MSQDLTDGQESEDALKVALDFAESIICHLARTVRRSQP